MDVNQAHDNPADSSYVKIDGSNIVRECPKHKGQQIGILNIQNDCESGNRLQCFECQYEMLSTKMKTQNPLNFIPIKLIEQMQSKDGAFIEFHNWPIINEDSRGKLRQYAELLDKAEEKVKAITDEVEAIIDKLVTALGSYKKCVIKNYFSIVEKAKESLPIIYDSESLAQIRDLLVSPDNHNINVELDYIIEQKNAQKNTFSATVSAKYSQFEASMKEFERFFGQLCKKADELATFATNSPPLNEDIQIKGINIQMVKSQGRESDRLNITTDKDDNSLILEKHHDFYGWAYSDIILDNSTTYKMEFSFKHPLNSYIMVGIIPNEYSDTEPPGSGTSHFCKIFGDQNNFYCGQVKQGDLIEKSLSVDEVITLKLCIDKNILEFSDTKGNINSLHHLYSLEDFLQYRFCVQFGQKSSNTIKIHSCHAM